MSRRRLGVTRSQLGTFVRQQRIAKNLTVDAVLNRINENRDERALWYPWQWNQLEYRGTRPEEDYIATIANAIDVPESSIRSFLCQKRKKNRNPL